MNARAHGVPLAKKLGLVGDVVFTVVHAPAGFAAMLGDVGDAIWQHNMIAPIDVVVGFYSERATLRDEWPALAEAAEPAGEVWVAWPKPAGGMAADITEDWLRAQLAKAGWADNKACTIDATWSALRFSMRKDTRPPWKR
jgi:hypothetical protein